LQWETQDRELPSQETLADAKVPNGAPLRLLSSEQLPPLRAERVHHLASQIHEESAIEVVVLFLDLNRPQEYALPLDVTVENLIRSFSEDALCHDRNHMGQTVYLMRSKALGRVLNGGETLRQAEIPRWDRLTVVREEVAG
jgi:hypothetical protein